MKDTYLGETLAKKVARLEAHFHARALLGGQSAYAAATHLCLASRVAGDASVLAGFDVPGEQIWMLERNAFAAEQARPRLTRGEHLVVDDVEQFSFRESRRFNHVFLDFCSPLTERLEATIFRVTRNLVVDAGVLTVGMMYGRDDAKGIERSLPLPGTSCDAATKRVFALETRIAERCLNFVRGEMVVRAWGAIVYRSKATPIVIASLRVHRRRSDESASVWEARRAAIYETERYDHGLFSPYLKVDAKAFDLRRRVLDVERKYPGKGALFYALSPLTIAAWKAHETRGTYRRRRLPDELFDPIEENAS